MCPKSDETTLLSHTAHAMLSPISSIYNLTGIILAGVDGRINEKVRRDVNEIARDAATLQEVLEAILGLLRLEEETPSLERIGVADAIRSAIASVESASDGHQSINIYIPTNVKTVYADRNMLYRVLYNALQHVLRFTSTGPIGVSASSWRGQVRFCIAPGDTPRRMKRAEFADVPGQQLRGVASVELMICRRLVRMHGGELWACQRPKQETTGLCFSIAKDPHPQKT